MPVSPIVCLSRLFITFFAISTNNKIVVTNIDAMVRSKVRSDRVWEAIMAVYFFLGVNLSYVLCDCGNHAATGGDLCVVADIT